MNTFYKNKDIVYYLYVTHNFYLLFLEAAIIISLVVDFQNFPIHLHVNITLLKL